MMSIGRLPIFSIFFADRRSKRHHYFGEIPLGGLIRDALIFDKQRRRCKMRAEEIALNRILSSFRYVTIVSGQCTHGVRRNLSVLSPSEISCPSATVSNLLSSSRKSSIRYSLHLAFVSTFACGQRLSTSGIEPRVVLLGMMSNNIVDLLYAEFIKMLHQHIRPLADQRYRAGRSFASLYKIRIIACAVRQGDKFIEHPPVPVDRPDGIYIWSKLSHQWFPLVCITSPIISVCSLPQARHYNPARC